MVQGKAHGHCMLSREEVCGNIALKHLLKMCQSATCLEESNISEVRHMPKLITLKSYEIARVNNNS